MAFPSEICIQSEFGVHHAGHNSKLLILCYSFLKEVGFPLERNGLHEVKGIFHIVYLDRKKEDNMNKTVYMLSYLYSTNMQSSSQGLWFYVEINSCQPVGHLLLNGSYHSIQQVQLYICYMTILIKLPWPVQGLWGAGQQQTQCTASSDNSSFQLGPLARPLSKTPATPNMILLNVQKWCGLLNLSIKVRRKNSENRPLS